MSKFRERHPGVGFLSETNLSIEQLRERAKELGTVREIFENNLLRTQEDGTNYPHRHALTENIAAAYRARLIHVTTEQIRY